MHRGRRSVAIFSVLAVGALTSGCAHFSPDAGMLLVEEQAGAQLNSEVVKVRDEADAAAIEARVQSLLAQQMSAESAVQIALLNNRGLQAAYNELGISEAQMVEASLPPSPAFALSKLFTTGQFEIERQIVQNVLGLLTLPRRREIAEDKFHQAQVRAVEATLRTAAEARRAYYRAVAANQIVSFLAKARTSAESVSELSKKLGETGALPKLDQAREHAFYAEISAQLATARLRQRVERQKLNRTLGLWGAQTSYKLPGTLAKLPPPPPSIADIETQAVLSRADLQIARMELTILAKQYGLTYATRFVNVLQVAGINTSDSTLVPQTNGEELRDKDKFNGYAIDFEIPIYDFGRARTRLAEQHYMRAVNLLIERAVNVRSQAGEAYQTYRGTYDIARHFEKEILPLRDIISEQELLNYSGMLTDVFELLADARARILANVQAIEARRDFWLAKVDLHVAIVGGGAGEAANPMETATLASGTGRD
ncbi:MAG: TolC family protein [Hyphomicrobium sp.]|nr:MAG: TolC family protein [Hyphomicrobium sp.]MBZ0209678.1 TolC family protein [Hyphomicrobium sp.]